MNEMAELTAALVRLVEAAASAHSQLPNEDTATVDVQARKALDGTPELEVAVREHQQERGLHLLHGLNNKLTGAMSLTMLAREDLEKGAAADAVLARVELLARQAAAAARAVALVLSPAP